MFNCRYPGPRRVWRRGLSCRACHHFRRNRDQQGRSGELCRGAGSKFRAAPKPCKTEGFPHSFSENGVQNWTCFPRAPNGSPEPSQNPFREHFGAQMASLGHNFQKEVILLRTRCPFQNRSSLFEIRCCPFFRNRISLFDIRVCPFSKQDCPL